MPHVFAKREIRFEAGPERYLAMLASATLHTIAIRARAGTGRAELEAIARGAVAIICGGRL